MSTRFAWRREANAIIQDAVKDTVDEVTDELLERVRANAEGFARTRYFAKSIRKRRRRHRGRVYSLDPFGHLVEWGSKNNPPYAPFRQAATSLPRGRFEVLSHPGALHGPFLEGGDE